MKKFIGICAFMSVRSQPSYRDFLSVHAAFLYCDVIARTMSQNRFEYIHKCLYVVPKDSVVHDWKDPAFDPIWQVQWLLDNLTENYQRSWHGSQFLCVDECMVPYNGRFCSFK